MKRAAARAVLSLRASKDEAVILRALAKRLKSDPAFGAQLASRLLGRKRAPDNLGLFLTQEDALQALIDHLVFAFQPTEIWLFGSRARGDARPDSDFDLLLVFDRPYDTLPDPMALRAAIAPLGLASDLMAYSQSGFEHDRTEPNSLAAVATKEGRRLYVRS